jgi:anti-anti-sigma factor
MSGLSLVTTNVNGSRVVLAAGELDRATAPDLDRLVAELADRDLVLDLWDVPFVDAAGFTALVAAHDRLKDNGRHCTFRGVHGTPLRMMQLLGLDMYLHLDGDGMPLAR